MISMSSVEEYLSGVKGDLQKGRYQIEHNRECNRKLVQDYVLHENKVIEILLSLRAEDFSAILQNEHEKFKHETLYVFGKEDSLLEKYGSEEKTVSLYIKFNRLADKLIVISFHEQEYPLTYFFA